MAKIIKYSITFIVFSIITSLLVFYFYILKGFSIENIHYKFVNIGKLYIKIDKKIIFKAKNIYINKKSDKNPINFKSTTKLIKDILQYLSFFQEINIQNLNINKNKINLLSLYKKKFIVDSDDIYLEASLFPKKTKINFNIYTLNIKKYNFNLNNINGYFYSDLLHLFIKINTLYNNTNVKLNLKISNKNIFYNGTINNISKRTLNLLKKELKIINNLNINSANFQGDKKVLNFDLNHINIKIKKFNLFTKNINGYFNLVKKIFFIKNKYILIKNNDLNLTIKLNNNDLKYSKEINFETKNLIINNNKNNISFSNFNINYFNNIIQSQISMINFKTPEINGEILSNSIFYNLNKKDGIIRNNNVLINYKFLKNIHIENIQTKFNINQFKIDSNIDIIHYKNINIKNINLFKTKNLIKLNFFTNSLLSKKLTSILDNFGIKIPIYQINGFNKTDAKIDYNLTNKKLHSNINIIIDNSKLLLAQGVFLDIKHSELNLKDTNITLKNSDLEFNKSIVNLKYHVNNGLINLNKFYIKTKGIIKDLNLTNIMELKNYPENLNINLNDLNISLQNLKTSILIKNKILININKLSILKPYILYLKQYNINQGNIKVIVGNKINIISNISNTTQPILEKNLIPIKKIELNTTIDNNKINIFNKFLNFNIINNKNLTIINGAYKNLDLNITKFIDTNNNKKENNSSSNKINIKTNIIGQNSYILYKNFKLYSQKLFIEYNGSNAKISSIYKDRNITILDNNGNIKIYALKIREKTLKELTNSDVLKKPLLTIFAIKNKNSEAIQGFIDIKKGYIKELKAFNNVLAFINLIPSLVTFQAVGFSGKGYKIKYGHIEYVFSKNILYLKHIIIKGENLDFNGQGYIDLNKNTIKLNVNVNLLVKLIKDIPIVNYILLGKDGGITLKLTINGSLSDPQVHKNTASNLIEAPLGIIKRTLLTPFRPFMEDK